VRHPPPGKRFDAVDVEHRASKNSDQDSVLPTGHFAGGPEDALDTACGRYLSDSTAWI
jgi:hypothetical protein